MLIFKKYLNPLSYGFTFSIWKEDEEFCREELWKCEAEDGDHRCVGSTRLLRSVNIFFHFLCEDQ